MRYLITVSYDGSKYFGFQKLLNEKTIQGELERVLTKINKSLVFVKGSGRTDRGVHSIGQKCHFDLNINISPDRLINAINSLLDDSIYVTDCKIVDNSFHARFNVVRKTYKYIVNIGKYNAIMNDYVYNYCYNLNIESMMEASKYLIGKKSFKAFVSGERDNYNSEIYNIKFNLKDNYLEILFEGKSFYRYMVRNMVGALILVGREKISISEFKNMIEKEENIYTYMTVPSNGLYLMDVEY